jgi:hypothetical protein
VPGLVWPSGLVASKVPVHLPLTSANMAMAESRKQHRIRVMVLHTRGVSGCFPQFFGCLSWLSPYCCRFRSTTYYGPVEFFLWPKSNPKVGESPVPWILMGRTAPAPFLAKKGSTAFRRSDLKPVVV